DRKHAVEPGVRRADGRDALHRAQRPHLGEGEVLDEPAGRGDPVEQLRGPAGGELRMRGHVRRAGQFRGVAGDQYPVRRTHDVGLDDVRAEVVPEAVTVQRVLWT